RITAREFDFGLAPLAVTRVIGRTISDGVLVAEFFDDLSERIAQGLTSGFVDVASATFLRKVFENARPDQVAVRAFLMAHVYRKDRRVRAHRVIECFIRS